MPSGSKLRETQPEGGQSAAMRATAQNPPFAKTLAQLRRMRYGIMPGREGDFELAAELMVSPWPAIKISR